MFDPVNLYNRAYEEGEDNLLSQSFCELLKRVDLSGKKILDLGCGTGILSAYLSLHGGEVTGVDFSSVAIERAQKNNGGVTFICADLSKPLPLDSNLFDIICDSHTSHCIVDNDHRTNFFNEIKRLLKKDGKLLMETMVRSSQMIFPDEYYYSEMTLFKRLDLASDVIDFPYRHINYSISYEELLTSLGLTIQYLTVSTTLKAQIDNIPQTLLPYAPDILRVIAIK